MSAPAFKVLIAKISVNADQSHFPIDISLPNDVKQVVGIAISNNATAWIAGEDSVSGSTITNLPASFIAAQKAYDRSNILEGKIRYRVVFDPYGEAYDEVTLNKYTLGTVSLKSYDKSGQFFNGPVQPKTFKVSYTDAYGGGYTGQFKIKEFEDKSRIYTPVNVDGSSTKITGFYQPFAFGQTIETPPTDATLLATTSFVAPYEVTIYLQYTTR